MFIDLEWNMGRVSQFVTQRFPGQIKGRNGKKNLISICTSTLSAPGNCALYIIHGATNYQRRQFRIAVANQEQKMNENKKVMNILAVQIGVNAVNDKLSGRASGCNRILVENSTGIISALRRFCPEMRP